MLRPPPQPPRSGQRSLRTNEREHYPLVLRGCLAPKLHQSAEPKTTGAEGRNQGGRREQRGLVPDLLRLLDWLHGDHDVAHVLTPTPPAVTKNSGLERCYCLTSKRMLLKAGVHWAAAE